MSQSDNFPYFDLPFIDDLFGAPALGKEAWSGIKHDSEEGFSAISTDSRNLPLNSLFVPIQGDRFDGHDYLADALRSGARGALSQVPINQIHPHPPEGSRVYQVDDTLHAITQLARAWRLRIDPQIIAVAGSVGKTTTKEMLATLLAQKYGEDEVLKTHGSQNGFLGIPLTLTALRPRHRVAVIEIGIDDIGAMAQHCETVQPNFGIITALAEEHLEKLKDLDTVIREECQLFEALYRSKGTMIFNLSDPKIAEEAGRFLDSKQYSYYLPRTGDPDNSPLRSPGERHLQAQIKKGAEGEELHFMGMDMDRTPVALPFRGWHQAANLMGAIACARAMGVSPSEIVVGVSQIEPIFGRSVWFKPSDQFYILADHYNASPASVRAGLETLAEASLPEQRKNWAILGDMLELGPDEEQYHRNLAPQIMGLGFDAIFLYGERMRWLSDELKQRNYAGHLEHFLDHPSLTQAVLAHKKGVSQAINLICKGSRGMALEKALDPLLEAIKN